MKLNPETRDNLVVISFILITATFVQVTGTPSHGTVQQDALKEVTHSNSLVYGKVQNAEFLDNYIPKSEISCIGDYTLDRGLGDNLTALIEVTDGKCVYPGKITKHYFEVYGFKVIL